MNSGSCFLREIVRITSSSRPGGTVSDSMSVTKPCRYFCPTSASRVGSFCGLLAMRISTGSFGVGARDARERDARDRDALGTCELGQRHVVERAADGGV